MSVIATSGTGNATNLLVIATISQVNHDILTPDRNNSSHNCYISPSPECSTS